METVLFILFDTRYSHVIHFSPPGADTPATDLIMSKEFIVHPHFVHGYDDHSERRTTVGLEAAREREGGAAPSPCAYLFAEFPASFKFL